MKTCNIGVIGCGLRSRMMVKLILDNELDVKVRLAAICDVKDSKTLTEELTRDNISCEDTKFYNDADTMLDEESLDGVVIGTHCNLHTDFAIKVMKRGLPLFLEKPVATNYEDWEKLRIAYETYRSEVVVSFPLRLTAIVKEVKSLIRQLELGPIQHVAAFNYVTYGGDYYHSWYRNEAETGGLFLQKATHDLDYITDILGLRPVELCAMNSKQIMKGDKPAGLLCENCAEKLTCPEGPYQTVHTTGDYIHGPYCCFAKDTGNEDSGTVIVRYETGMHVVYTQNFFVRNKLAGRRGAIFSGEGGTIEFDWVKSEIIVHKQYLPGEMRYEVKTVGNHGGGDAFLAQNFIGVMLGIEKSQSPLEKGLLSAHMCLKARESALSHKFVELEYYE